MNTNAICIAWLAVMVTPLAADDAVAQDEIAAFTERGSRYELWLGASHWPALGDLLPAGAFEETGIAIGGAIHTPLRRYTGGDLLFGIDASFASSDSSIEGWFGDLVARHMYLGVSTKYRFGARRNLSLDAGVGYHLADFADVATGFYGLIEDQVWESSAFGYFIGTTIDFGMTTLEKRSGWFVSVKAHFADFGHVTDNGTFFGTTAGGGAGRLDGPLYLLAIGYAGE